MEFAIDYVLIPFIKILVVFLVVSGVVAYLTLAERKVAAFIQVRLGPMRVGPYGLLQPIADGLKLMLKEDIVPNQADKWIFTLAPIITLIPAFIVLAVIPFGPTINILGRPVSLYITDLNIGVLYVLSISSVGILGIILGGWASNSKYPLLGALRSAAQMVSYEVALGFSIMGVLMLAGSLSLVKIVEAQKDAGYWYVFQQPVAFLLFFVCALAETNRAPFDLPEAESELGGGWLRPFPNVETFLGIPLHFLDLIPPVLWFAAKVVVFLYTYLWFRWTWPRYRYDQLMKVGWQWLLPIAMANVIVTAILVLVLKG